MIEFQCPECGAQVQAPDESAGKARVCPVCRATVRVPGEEPRKYRVKAGFWRTKVYYPCPGCGEELESNLKNAGKREQCPLCSEELIVPGGEGQKRPDKRSGAKEQGEGDGEAEARVVRKGGARRDAVGYVCRECGEYVESPRADAGKTKPCPKCGVRRAVPRPERGVLTYAGFWKLAAAFIIDGLIVSVVGIPVMVLSFRLIAVLEAFGATGAGQAIWIPAGVVVVFLCLYFAGFESSGFQATPGKMVLGIHVADAHGEPIGFLQATTRRCDRVVINKNRGASKSDRGPRWWGLERLVGDFRTRFERGRGMQPHRRAGRYVSAAQEGSESRGRTRVPEEKAGRREQDVRTGATATAPCVESADSERPGRGRQSGRRGKGGTLLLVLTLVALAVGVPAAFLVADARGRRPSRPKREAGREAASGQALGDREIEAKLAKGAEEGSRNLPMMMNESVRLDAVLVPGGRRLVYTFTIMGVDPSEVDSEALAAAHRAILALRPVLVRLYRTAPEGELWRKNNVVATCLFFAEDGTVLAEITVGPDDLQ